MLMKNDRMELPVMDSTVLCRECCSINTRKIEPSSLSARCLMAAGYYLLECKSCSHRWKEFSPLESLLNLVYLLLAAEVVFLAMNYFNIWIII